MGVGPSRGGHGRWAVTRWTWARTWTTCTHPCTPKPTPMHMHATTHLWCADADARIASGLALGEEGQIRTFRGTEGCRSCLERREQRRLTTHEKCTQGTASGWACAFATRDTARATGEGAAHMAHARESEVARHAAVTQELAKGQQRVCDHIAVALFPVRPDHRQLVVPTDGDRVITTRPRAGDARVQRPAT